MYVSRSVAPCWIYSPTAISPSVAARPTADEGKEKARRRGSCLEQLYLDTGLCASGALLDGGATLTFSIVLAACTDESRDQVLARIGDTRTDEPGPRALTIQFKDQGK
jgi:hypothetical protein